MASDHHLVVATLKLRLKRHGQPTGPRTPYNVDLQRDRKMRDKFQASMSNKFQVLQDLYDAEGVTDIETAWTRAKKVCEETIGKKKYTHKDWMSLD